MAFHSLVRLNATRLVGTQTTHTNHNIQTAIFQSLQTLQKRIDALEREKTESGAKIQSLENELLGTRQLLFHKQATSESNLIRPTVAPPLLQEESKVSIGTFILRV
jgi:hypothetical protein